MPTYNFEIEYGKIDDLGWFNIIQALLVKNDISDAHHNGVDTGNTITSISLSVETKKNSSLSREEVWALIQGMVSGTELTEAL